MKGGNEMNDNRNQTENSKVVIDEIISICEELGVQVDTKMPTEKNKFLSACKKRSTLD